MACERARLRAILAALWLYHAAAVASPVHASPLLELAGSVGDQGGRQGRNEANGASAAYFNPALLIDAPSGLTAGFVVLHSHIDIGVFPRTEPRADVPNDLENGAHADGSRWDAYPLGTEILEQGRESTVMYPETSARPRQAAGSARRTLTYEALGAVGQYFDGQLALGAYLMIPNGDFLELRSFYVDEREQFFTNSLHPELYSDRLAPLSLSFGGGVRLHETFSLGFGTGFTIRAAANTPAFVADASRLQDLRVNVDARARLGLSPYGGFAWRPLPRWRITGTLHAPQQQEVEAEVDFLLASGLEQTSTIRFVFDWMPWQASLGTGVDVLQRGGSTVSLVASALYGRWSQYVDRHGERPLPGLAFQDTLTGTVGARGSFDALRLALDLEFRPSPVPPQFGRSNYVDNDRLGTSVNAEYAFEVRDTTLRVGVALQWLALFDRSVRKLSTPTFDDGQNRTPSLVTDEVPDDGQVGGEPIAGAAGLQTNNPGWPGFDSGGWLLSGSVYVGVSL